MKRPHNLESRLEGHTFDVYMRLSQDDKKDVEKIKSELLKEFEKGNQDREIAIHELNNRKRKPDESAQRFQNNGAGQASISNFQWRYP